MAVITLLIGQCGNQIGVDFFSALAEGAADSDPPVGYFRSPGARGGTATATNVARAVLVDTEPKVIQQVTATARRRGLFAFPATEPIGLHEGAANNWAFGYSRQAPRCAGHVLEQVRREVEACDALRALVNVHSLAGGTGSGVGAYLAEQLHDDYACVPLVHHVVWPFSAGEVTLQNYNTLLSFATLHQVADAAVLFQNDALSKVCMQGLGIERPTFEQLNAVVATDLAAVCLPSRQVLPLGSAATRTTAAPPRRSSLPSPGPPPQPSWNFGRSVKIWEDPIRLLCDTRRKVLTLTSAPCLPDPSVAFSAHTWQGLLKELQPQRRKLPQCMAFLRGPELTTAQLDYTAMRSLAPGLTPLGEIDGYPPFAGSQLAFQRYAKHVALLTNTASVSECVNHVLKRSIEMHNAKAYLHHLRKYDVEERLEDAFAIAHQVAADYLEGSG